MLLNVAEEIVASAAEHGVPASQIPVPQQEQLKLMIESVYQRNGPSWDSLVVRHTRVHDPGAWRLLPKLLPGREEQRIVVWPQYPRPLAVILDGNPSLLPAILVKPSWKRLLVCDEGGAYLIVFDEETKVLYCAGGAVATSLRQYDATRVEFYDPASDQ